MTRFGIEEEFALLDEATLVPLPLGSAARKALPSGSGEVAKEFLTSQIEFSTSPVKTLAAAEHELRAFREALDAFAREHGAVAIGTGTPFGVGPSASVSPSARYAMLAHRLGHIIDGHHVSGLHVHVEIPDDQTRVRTMNAVRPWLPVLLALSGNSPYADGHDTRYQSWRSIVMRRLPLAGCPPHFPDIDSYHATIDRLVEQGVILDVASVSWTARLSDRYPTLEFRVFDAQLTADDTLLLAALARALAMSPPGDGRWHDGDAIQASLWAASRDGLDATLMHPGTDTLIPAREAAELLLQTLEPTLADTGDLAFAQRHLHRILRSGNGAERQRAAYAEHGIAGLRSLHSGMTLPSENETGDPEERASQATA